MLCSGYLALGDVHRVTDAAGGASFVVGEDFLASAFGVAVGRIFFVFGLTSSSSVSAPSTCIPGSTSHESESPSSAVELAGFALITLIAPPVLNSVFAFANFADRATNVSFNSLRLKPDAVEPRSIFSWAMSTSSEVYLKQPATAGIE